MTHEQMDRLKRAIMSVKVYEEQILVIEARMSKTTQSMSETGVRGGGGSPDKFSALIYAHNTYEKLLNKAEKEADALTEVCELWLRTLPDDLADAIKRVEVEGEPLARVARDKGIPRKTLYYRIQQQFEEGERK